jgi:membrane-associated phospholipid phosphatase
MGPDLVAVALLGALVVGVSIAYHQPLHGVSGSTWMPVGALATFIAVAVVQRLRRGRRAPTLGQSVTVLVRDWAPLVMAIVVYDNFHDMTRIVRPDTVDDVLAAWDARILGAPASIALQAIVTPWLTELMTFCYALFFVFPTIVLVRAYARGDTLAFREAGVAMSLAFYLGLVGYMLVPAVGPRFAFPERFSVPLEGWIITQPASAMWRSLQQVDRDCFPSLHTAMSTIALVYLWRFRFLRYGWALFAISAPLVAGLWLSTLYLRYHHFVDVIAGFGLAGFCLVVSPRLTGAFHALWISENSRARNVSMKAARSAASVRPVAVERPAGRRSNFL